MKRVMTAAVLLGILLAVGCDNRPEGMVAIETAGSLQLNHEIFYTQEHMDWDVKVECTLTGSFGHETLHVYAYDNTFRDGLVFELQVQEFAGNGPYTRTENQPLPALELELTDDETDTWILSTTGGGVCTFDIDSGGREGVYHCTDVYGWVTETLTFADVEIAGEWSCTGIYWDNQGDRGER